jgi:hypothetical protein
MRRSSSATRSSAGRSLPPRPPHAGPPPTLHRVEFDEGDLGPPLRVLDSGPSAGLALEALETDSLTSRVEREAERGAGPGERDEAEVRLVDGGGRRLSPASASARSRLVKPVATRWMELVAREYGGGERTRTEGGRCSSPGVFGRRCGGCWRRNSAPRPRKIRMRRVMGGGGAGDSLTGQRQHRQGSGVKTWINPIHGGVTSHVDSVSNVTNEA